MDLGFDKLERFLLQWALIAFHWISEAGAKGYDLCMKSFIGLQQAHQEDVWVFMDSNTNPWAIKGEWQGESDKVYTPETHTFMRSNQRQEGRLHQFHFVTAELVKGDSLEDCTEIFHEINWSTGANPSLLEVVLLHGLHKGKPYSVNKLKEYTLRIMDDNADTHDLLLDSEVCTRAFRGLR
jgi:hypothetical protein